MKDKDKQFMRNSEDSTRQSRYPSECPDQEYLVSYQSSQCVEQDERMVNANFWKYFVYRTRDSRIKLELEMNLFCTANISKV